MRVILGNILEKLVTVKDFNDWTDDQLCCLLDIKSILDIVKMNTNQLITLKEVLDFEFDDNGVRCI